MTQKYFVKRTYPEATSDESAAMAYQSWGPYFTRDEAVQAMATNLRNESVGCKRLIINQHLRHHEFYIDRAARFDQAADTVIEHRLNKVTVQGVCYHIQFNPLLKEVSDV